MPGSGSLETTIFPFEPFVCTIGPDFKNSPVSAMASSSEPPPFRRRSMMRPAMFSFFKRLSRVSTSLVVLFWCLSMSA